MEIAVLALGCFWGPEIKFGKLDGVIKTEVGYCGGNSDKTTYEKVCSGTTNHAEVVRLEFDPKIISYEKILSYFFEIHDPTTLNQQGPDIGTQYRSAIYYNDSTQEVAAKQSKEKNSTLFSGPIVTEITAASKYYLAEDYHQKYLEKRGMGSCH